MANISEITQGASYQGNPALGGGFGVGVTIDATPLDKLAAFTFQKDSMLYEQKQKDDVKAAAEIADTLNLDITNTLPQYQDDLKAKMIDLQEFYRKNPNSVVYGRDPKGFQEAKEKKRILTTALKNAKATDLAYQLKKTNIDTLPDGAEKEMKKAFLEMSLEEHFNEGVDKSYSKVLKTDPTITPESYKIPEIPSSEISEITILPNQFVTTETKYRNPSAYYTLGNVALLNTDYKKIDTESEDFKNLTEKQKIAKIRESEFKYANRQALQNQSNELANVLNQMQKRFGEENPDANFELTKENIANYSTSKTVTDLLNSFIEFNEKSKEIKTLTTTNNGGKDPTGKVVDPNLINGMGIDELITPAGIVALKKFAADGNTFLIKQEKKITETNEKIEKQKLAEDARQANLANAYQYAALDQDRDQFNASLSANDKSPKGGEKNKFEDGNLYDLLVELQKGYFNDKGQTLVMRKEDVLGTDNIAKAFDGDKRFNDADGIAIIDGKVTFQKLSEDGKTWENIGAINEDETNNKGRDYKTKKDGAAEIATQPVYPNKKNTFNLADYFKEKGIK